MAAEKGPDTSNAVDRGDSVEPVGGGTPRPAPDFATDEQVQRSLGSIKLTAAVVLVGIRGRLYKREGGRWRLLDNKSYSSVREMTQSVNGSEEG